MRECTASNIKFHDIDDLFGIPKESEDGKIAEVPLQDLHAYHNHPFRVLDDEKMEEMADSIKENGVLVPGIVRPREEGGYEIIAGHRRKRGCELAGLSVMPVIIRDLDDDEADVIMVDSNIQRENLLYSEKAFAYQIKFEALKHQGSRGKVGATDFIGSESGESGRQIQRYIRLTKLDKKLLDMVDAGKIKFIPAEKLSYLSAKEQGWLLGAIEKTGLYPKDAVALNLKKLSLEKELSEEVVERLLADRKKGPGSVTISTEKIREYFPKSYSKSEIEKVIYELLDNWKNSQ